MQTIKETILDLAEQKGMLRAKDLSEGKLPRTILARLLHEGKLVRLSRGLYALPDRVLSERSALAEVSIKFPRSVFCLLTALQFYEITTQPPFQVWLAVNLKARTPKIQYPPLKVVRFADEAFEYGVQDVVLDGVVRGRVTSLEKTIADCFKFRNKIGIDIAIEALQKAWRSKRISLNEIRVCAKICRVNNVMTPYLESLSD